MENLRQRLLEESKDGRISCHQLRALAEDLGVSYKSAGEAANDNDIKIIGCELGCF